MREPNISFPAQNKAAICITSALYDRRALDCTSTLPLINSLTHLAYLTSTSPRIREILCLDGGLERLVRILSPDEQHTDRRSLWKWSLAFQCVVNVGVRGTEQIRTKVVEAGMIPIVLRVLENFLCALDIVRLETERQKIKFAAESLSASAAASATTHSSSSDADTRLITLRHLSASFLSNHTSLDTNLPNALVPPASPRPSRAQLITASTPQSSLYHHTDTRIIFPTMRRSTLPYVKIDPEQRRRNRIAREPPRPSPTWQDPRMPCIDKIFYREEDILLSLQLLAYLSKYPYIRTFFHAYDHNVFTVVEKFCHRLHPSGIQYWAGVIMRNACRKDETRGGIRRCANMHCGTWEQFPREFAKCRRCRKAKYCSKACQSSAWAEGHRWWCVERQVAPRDLAEHPQEQTPHELPTETNPLMIESANEGGPHERTSVRESQATIVVSELNSLPAHARNDLALLEQDLNDPQQGAESSETRLLMEIGMPMEL
ncbi:hypothetical protein BDF14DRAFT_1992052 [Spinellus fusiger]|nr:hypothetical protein BDF14DRAFT_1992052 [Spinellus fusiger]